MKQLSCSIPEGRSWCWPKAGTIRWIATSVRRPVPVIEISKSPSISSEAASALSVTSFVDDVRTQRFEIDLRPIGFRICIEDLHNLLDRSECILARPASM
jgi:hypothetical protein